MPIHDWTRLEPGDFHDFHQCWVVEIRNALNRGLLPPEYMAMAEQVTGRPIPDVVTLHARPPKGDPGGIAVATAPPTARVIAKFDKINYAKRADRVIIRHGRGKVVAIVEIVSPGNKDSRNAIRTFVEKAADILNQGVNLLVVDLFPPTRATLSGFTRQSGTSSGTSRSRRRQASRSPSHPTSAASSRWPTWSRSASATHSRRCRSFYRTPGTSRPLSMLPIRRPGQSSRPCSKNSSTRPRLADSLLWRQNVYHDEMIEKYLAGPKLLRNAIVGMTREELLARPIPGKWSAQEVVCHLADYEPIYADRMKRVIALEQPELLKGDPGLFASRLAYGQRNVEEELTLIEVTRTQMARILRTLKPEDFQRNGAHFRDGVLTLENLLQRITGHIPHHVRFIEEKRRALTG